MFNKKLKQLARRFGLIWRSRIKDWCCHRDGETLYEKLTKSVYLIDNLVECERCGCLLNKNTAIKGKSKIVKESNLRYFQLLPPVREFEEKIKPVYYCKCCAPKKLFKKHK